MKRRPLLGSALATTAAIAVPSLIRAQGTEQREVAVAVGGKTSFFYPPFVLGDAFNNVRQTYSPDGIVSDAAARTAARSLATIEDHIDPAQIDSGRLYSNEFVQRAAKKYA